jgi:hypothetical protein
MLEFKICQNQKIKKFMFKIFSMMYTFMFFPLKVVNSFQEIKI